MTRAACPACGTQVDERTRFCPQCGLSLSGSVSQSAPGATSPSLSLPMPGTVPPGTLLDEGRYRIIGLLNAGSFGAVYEAANTRLRNAKCAVKELREDRPLTPQERAESEAWFVREAELLMDLQHPMIPRIWDQFSEGTRHYLVMDLVPGRNLEQELAAHSGPFPEVEALNWGVRLCDVLSYLHGHQPPIVFRDLKPANIMLKPDGMLVLVDFGIARGMNAAGAGGTLRPGTMIGTPGYAPLEQYQGQAEPRSDLYALGATLHRVLTGYNPEQGKPLFFPPARELRSDLHADTERVLARAVQMQPSDRFPDAQTLAASLAMALKTLTAPSVSSQASSTVRMTQPPPSYTITKLDRGQGNRHASPSSGQGEARSASSQASTPRATPAELRARFYTELRQFWQSITPVTGVKVPSYLLLAPSETMYGVIKVKTWQTVHVTDSHNDTMAVNTTYNKLLLTDRSVILYHAGLMSKAHISMRYEYIKIPQISEASIVLDAQGIDKDNSFLPSATTSLAIEFSTYEECDFVHNVMTMMYSIYDHAAKELNVDIAKAAQILRLNPNNSSI